jgi:hypothetical protein
MSGEFRGDFTRDTFEPREHFIRVLSQQGRVWLDADWNEQASILLHYIQTLARDIIGDWGGWDDGFLISSAPEDGCNNDFVIHEGHYYVDGILCENEKQVCYSSQPDYHLPDDETFEKLKSNNSTVKNFLAYLDVWERHVSYIQDRDKYRSIREVALGVPDTATRSKLVCQVKVKPLGVPPLDIDDLSLSDCRMINDRWDEFIQRLQPVNRGLLRAEAKFADQTSTLCMISPESKFTGDGNYLYRVEIHRGGRALGLTGPDGGIVDADHAATFKWSRNNGSVEFPCTVELPKPQAPGSTSGDEKETVTATLDHIRCNDHPCISEDDWVEIVDDDYVLQNRAEPLWQVRSIDSLNLKVVLERKKWDKGPSSVGSDPSRHPLLRRWDQKEGELKKDDPKKVGQLSEGTAVIVESNEQNPIWIQLENGIKVLFNDKDGINEYSTGDYWLIPARAATGDIEWPKDTDEIDQRPKGIGHHYAPLGIITLTSTNAIGNITDCRCIFERLWPCEKRPT